MIARTLLLGFAAASLCACASVKVPLPGLDTAKQAEAEPTQTRDELAEAATRLALAAPDGAPGGRGLSLVVFGGRDDAEKADAAHYLSGLTAPGDRLDLVMDDVDHVLSLARQVAEAGRPASALPGDADVDLLEDAIKDVQRARRVYVAALKALRDEGTPLTKAEIREVGDAFVQSARDIGVAADLVAARLDAPAAPQLATTPSVSEGGY